MIDITGIDLVKFAQKVYELSSPQGMGHFHYTKAPLTDEMASDLVHATHSKYPLDMDYIRGRACKMTVYKQEDGRLYIHDVWYDHTDQQYKELLETFGIKATIKGKHGISCNCAKCRWTNVEKEMFRS